MLQFKDLELRRGSRLLLDGVSLNIHPGFKVGITGANGSGKSSLFELILDRLAPDSGLFSMPDHWVVAHVAQVTPALEVPAIEYVMDGDREYRQLQSELAQAEKRHDGLSQARLHQKLEDIDAYSIKARAAALLHGLGFTSEQQTLTVASFSGGWRMRLNLAQALLCRSDLLLLDEPTNHLDLDALLWLEQWLGSYKGTLLLISHDREFLDAIAQHIISLENGAANMIKGNYSEFEHWRAMSLAQQSAQIQKQEKQRNHIESFIRRFKAKASKARQARSRMKTLERMQNIAPIQTQAALSFSFPQAIDPGPELLRVQALGLRYEKKCVLRDVDMVIAPGDRFGLLGANGAGKSSLIRLLAQVLAPTEGEVLASAKLSCAYFAQHQLEQLDLQDSPLGHLQRRVPTATEQTLRDFLGGFGFNADQVLQPVAPFSGGEKARLVLAMLVIQKPNLLLLDEPSNHLDLQTRQSLAMALQSYEGAMVLVSHDRFLLQSCCDSFYLVNDTKVSPFDGDLEDYRAYLLQQTSPDSSGSADKSSDRKQKRRDAAQQRQRSHSLRQEITLVEEKISILEQEKSKLESQMANPELYNEHNKAQLKQMLAEQRRVQTELQQLETVWAALLEKLDELS